MQNKPTRKATIGMTVFTHIDEHGVVRHFDIGYLERLVAVEVEAGRMEVVPVAVTAEGIEVIHQDRGVDEHRLKRVAQIGLDMEPLFFAADVSPGTHLLIDGTHRYLWAGMVGLDVVPAVLLPKEVWEGSLVDAVDFMGEDLTPERLLAHPSFM